MPNSVDIQVVIGRNVRRLRGKASMADLAVIASEYGEVWDAGSIGKIEAGKYKATIQLLGVLSMALTRLTGREVRVHEFLWQETPQLITLNRLLVAEPASLLSFLAGEKVLEAGQIVEPSNDFEATVTAAFRNHPEAISLKPAGRVYRELTHGDRRIAREVSLSPEVFAVWCSLLWSRTFTAERDVRAGDNASAQKRGRVSRELKQELRDYMERYGHGDGQ